MIPKVIAPESPLE